jgi:2-acylglycerol O-acyltransferase 2
VPVYGFGETSVFGTLAPGDSAAGRAVRRVTRHLSFQVPLVKGRGWFNYGFGLLPHRQPIHVVVGAPLVLPAIAAPTRADVAEWHGKYVVRLEALFAEYRDVYAPGEADLRIVK